MTPRERVLRARRGLTVAIVTAALLWAACAAMAILAVAALVDRVLPFPDGALGWVVPMVVVGAVVGAALVLWRGRAARSESRVALWVEEHDPRLRFALVAAIDPTLAPAERYPELHAAAAAADIEHLVRRAWVRIVGRAAAAALVVAAVLALSRPAGLLAGAGAEIRAALTRPPAPLGNRLLGLTARIEPPAYARAGAQTVREPASIAALVGSRVTLSAAGPAEGVSGVAARDTVAASEAGRRWAIALAMPREPLVVTLRDRAYRRLVVLEPRVDSAPAARLRLPAGDTTYQEPPRGRLEIEAQLDDDVGLAFAYVEYMLTTGSAENYETRVVNGRREPLGNARSATLRATLRFDTLGLKPGSVLHVRVVAYDFNDVTGPGKGVSETRTLRVAEPIDSTSINAAPPLPIDSMWVSQRLLNMRTDTLIREERRLQRPVLVARSSSYSNVQEDIRKRALAVIAVLEDNGVGGAFETETSLKLREAVDLMWTARTHLGVAEPDTAMPYMKRILKILDEIRLAHRYYLRGLLKPVPVNVERVRLTGTDSGKATAREPRAVLPDLRAALAARIDAAAALARTAPTVAADSLTYARVAALSAAPAVAAPLQEAIVALRGGRPADGPLARARRALEPRPRILGGPAEWGGIAP